MSVVANLGSVRKAVGLIASFVALFGCGQQDAALPTYELAGSAMGTTYSVKLVEPPANVDREQLGRDLGDRLEALEQSMSTYRADSELTLFNVARSTDWVRVSAELCEVIAAAQTISALSDGAFDVTVGPLVNLWGFGPDGERSGFPSATTIEVARTAVGYNRLETDCDIPALRKQIPDLYVDLSAFAKGYAVDWLAQLLDNNAITNYLVEIGGELRLRGTNGKGEPWAIAIETPMRSGRSVQAIIGLSDTAMATSGDYRNFFEHDGRFYSHTIDPKSGYPVEHNAASVTVVARQAAFADAMATALLVMGPDEGLAFAEDNELAAYFLLRSGDGIEERASSRFAREVELR